MKLSELAQEYNLDAGLLREVVKDDLGIALARGMDSVMKPADIKRILACDGLETADGKAFAPIIDKEFEEKHKRSVAARKAAETRKKKVQDEVDVKKQEDVVKLASARRHHEEDLKRRQADDEARKQIEQLAVRAREMEDAKRNAEEEGRRQAEEELRRRADEGRRLSAEFAAIRAANHRVEPPAAEVVAEASAAPQVEAPVVAQAVASVTPTTDVQSVVAAASMAASGGPVTLAESSAAVAAAPKLKVEAPKPVEVLVEPTKNKGLGTKLASMAKATHEKADHSIKAIVKPEAPVVGVPGKPDEALTPEDRRKLIQANIQRNLDIAKRVAQAKATDKGKKPGFRTIDRTKAPGPGGPARGPGGPARGPGGPGRGPGGPGGPGRPAGRGRGRDAKDAKPEDGEAEGRSNRRFRSTLEEDISGVTEFEISLPCTVREFSEASGVKSSIVIAKLFMLGVMGNINSVLDKDAVELLGVEFKKTVKIIEAKDVEQVVEEAAAYEDKDEDLAPRPPIVTIMGHVDHGKTSLLDSIRKTQVAAGEAGGITQHIGAYTVSTASGMDVTFIDTPGHQAFTEMRARGSQITDVAVIVVAADDGVMPQTVEAINHAKAAGVAIVVAMNKIDKPEATAANQEKVIRQLAEAGLQAEEWGGEIGVVRVSALSGEGIDALLERLALETEILDLKANHFAKASGTVIEARRQEGQGVTATVLVQRGSLAIGDVVLAGVGYGRMRAMTNWKGDRTKLAGPSTAVEVIGLDEMPRAGDRFQVFESLKEAAEAAELRRQTKRERELAARAKTSTTASVMSDIAHSRKKEIKVVVKADASGSLEVLTKTIQDLATNDVRVTIIHGAVGGVTSSDVSLAGASKALILGFHVIADAKARGLAEDNGVEIRSYTIIYELLDDLKAALAGALDPVFRDAIIGHAEVRACFTITNVGMVAGLYVTDGLVRRDAFMRITRDEKILHTGKVGTLRRFKEDVKEVRTGFECGLTVEKFQNIQVGDLMEFYNREKVVAAVPS